MQDSFFEIEDAATVRVANTVVTHVSTQEVERFCSEYHYSKHAGSAMWRWGLWHESALLGVIAYNLPTRETCQSLFGQEHYDKVWHMGRLAMSDDAPPNSESRLISLSLKAIQAERPDIWAVVTFADATQGHIGYVYQATNAIYTGLSTRVDAFVDERGHLRGSYLDGRHVSRARAEKMGWEYIGKALGKHRYVYILGNKREKRNRLRMLKLPTLPYPKETCTKTSE